MKYRPEIDGLRSLAVIPVILFHAGSAWFRGGFVGVDVFFVISGYLITTILLDDLDKNTFNFAGFYERRARRILPVLYLVSACTTIASIFILYPEDLLSLANSLISTPLFLANFYFWSERGYFGGETDLKPLIHLWSLSIEAQFYLIFPIFLLLITKSRNLFFVLLFSALVISLIASFYVTLIHFDTAFYFPITRAWELLIGVVAALFIWKRPFKINCHTADFISLTGLLLILYAIITFNETTLFPYLNALIPTTGAFLFIITSDNSKFCRYIFSSKIFVFIGTLSFSLYLWHQPIFALSKHLNVFADNLTAIIALIFFLSYASYRLVEKPTRNRESFSRRSTLSLSIIGGFLIVAGGIFIAYQQGLPSRYPRHDRELLTQLSTYQNYNQKLFDSLRFENFSRPQSIKILLVGDSYAKDLLNIFNESGKFRGFEFSTKQINPECGNLLLDDYREIEKHIPISRLYRCRLLGRYEGKRFSEIASEADEIWIASRWHDWVIDHIPVSINNLTNKFDKPVRVFGTKHFGDINVDALLSLSPADRPSYTQTVNAQVIKESEMLAKKLKDYVYFYPLLDALCGGSAQACRIFDPNGFLLSADDRHLTKKGAIEAASRIEPTLNSIIESVSTSHAKN